MVGVQCFPVIRPFVPTQLRGWDHAFGDLTLRTEASRMQVKGNLVRTRARYVLETYGEGMLRELRDALAPDAAAYLSDPPLPNVWCSYAPLLDLDCLILNRAMRGDVNLMKMFGYMVAGYDLPTVYKVLFKLGSPARLLQLSGLAWSLYFRPGRVTSEALDATSARMTLEHSVVGRYLCEFGMSGWIEATVAGSGAVEPRCEHVRCRHRHDPVCEWRVQWKA